jgi:hypothetical protein
MAFQVKSTRREAPVRAVFYGPGGIGKSTLAAAAPKTIFVAAEEGLENIDAQTIEPYPKTWEDVLGALDHIATLRDFDTVAIDSLDWLEPLCWNYVCRKGGKADIEAFGYGKGYVAALDQWRVFLHKLSALRERGMNVLLIAHGVRKPFKNPLGDDYEHWTVKLHDKAAGLIVEWCDVVGFCCEDIATDDSSGRTKGRSTGKRIIRTHPNAAYLAKTRFAVPPKIALDWPSFAAAVKAGGPAAIERLQGELNAKLAELADKDVEKGCLVFLKDRGVSVASLSEAIATVDDYLAERRKAS